MRRRLASLLACSMALSLTTCGGGSKPVETMAVSEATTATVSETAKEESKEDTAEATVTGVAGGDMGALIEVAKAEGELTVYGSCEEGYLLIVCQNSEKLYGIRTKYQGPSTSEVYTRISEEAGKPFADTWPGGITDPYNETVADGLLMEYNAINAKNLTGDQYKDPTSYWYGVYRGILGFMTNAEELDHLGLETPKIRDDFTKGEYKGPIMLFNPNAVGTAKLLVNTVVQMKGHDETMEYSKALDKNIFQCTKSGSGPFKMIGPGECITGIGFLHDGIYQTLQGYDSIQLIVPKDGISFEVSAAVIFNGCAHPNAAKLQTEYALSPDCVDHTKENGSCQFLALSNATRPGEAIEFNLDINNTIDYDFEDAKGNNAKYVEDFLTTLGDSPGDADPSRFLTEQVELLSVSGTQKHNVV